MSTNVADLAAKHTKGKVDSPEAHRTLDAMVERLQKLKRKLEEIKQEETVYSTRTKQRLDHLEELANIQHMDTDTYENWSKARLDRMLVDYLLRNGCMTTARKLAKDATIEVRFGETTCRRRTRLTVRAPATLKELCRHRAFRTVQSYRGRFDETKLHGSIGLVH